jgi:two-component system, NtrC family, response regulator PilR
MVRIMIIEDDKEMRSLLKDFLEEEGFETDSASNGVDALQVLSKDHFDLVITDIRMPGLTGLDILPRMRRLKPEIPIIVMTAYGSDDVRRRSLERGATIYLEKPIHLSKLRTVIREMALRKSLEQTWSNAES